MKTYHIFKYTLVLLAFFLLSCDSQEEQEDIFVYFGQSELTLKPGSENAVEIPINVFSTSKIDEDINISYTLEGEGRNQIEDISGGVISIQKGFKAYKAYIKLAAKSDEDAEGDTAVQIKLHSDHPKVIMGLGNESKNNSLQLTVVNENASCLASLWKGSIVCGDSIYPSYSPSSCSGEIVGEDCQKLRIEFDFWADANLPTVLDLELSAVNIGTNTGTVTLLEDYNVEGSGYNITFYKGDAGTYDVKSGELNLVLGFSGYDIGGDGKYRFTIKK